MALKVGELFASFNLDTSGIDGAISGAEKKLSSLGKGMAIGGAAMSAAVTAPIVGAFKDIYSKGSEFNSQMSKVFAIRGLDSTLSADVESMDQLNAKALEMGSTTKFTASEAGQAFEYMAMAGWDTASMLGGIEPILNLAAAAGEDLGTTSDIVTDAMTAFGYTIDKVGGDTQKFTEMTTHFTDVLAAVSSNANTNVSMLGESFKYVGSIAGSLGYSIEDTAVALGIMANSGIKSSQAGTSLRTIMTRLNGDIKISGKNLKEVTVKTSNADGSMRDFSEIIADCREAFKGLTESEKAQVAESLVGRNAMSGFLTLMNATDDEIASLTGAINNCSGATKRMADMMLDNVGGSVTLFKSAVEGLEITMWELVKGPVKDLIDRATGVVDAFRNMDSATQMGALKMAGFAAAIGPVLTASGGLLMALPKIAKGVAALASPLGVVGIGLLAFTAAAMDSNNQIGQTFEKMGKGVKKTLTGVNKQLNKKFLSWNYKTGKSAIGSRMIAFSESITAGLKDIIPAGMDTVRLFMKALMTGISDSASSLAGIGKTVITELLNGITRSLPELVPLAAKMVSNIASALISNAPEILSAGVTLFTTLIESLNKVNWAQIGTKINEAVKTALSDIKTNLFTLVFGEEPKGEDLGDWGKFGSKVVEKIKDGIQTASQNGKNLIGGLVLEDDYNPDDSWGTVAGKIWNKITTTMGSFLSGAGDLIKGLVLGEDYTADASWENVGKAVWDKAKAGFDTLAASAKDLVGQLVLGDDYTADTSWSTIGSAVWDAAKSGFDTLAATAKDFVGKFVLGDDYTADTSWSKIGSEIWEKAKAGFAEAFTLAKEIIGTFVLGDDYDPGDSWKKIGAAIWDKAKDGFSSAFTAAKDIIGTFALGDDYEPGDSWKKIGSGIWTKAQEGFKGAYKTAKDIIGTFALGDDYTADESWAKIGQALWDKIKEKLTALSANAKDLIGNLVYSGGEEGYSADKSWANIGSALWEKVQSGITAGKDMAAAILEKIGSVEIDVEGVMTTVKNAGTFVTNLVGNMLNGRITWGTKITDLARKIGNKFAAYGWDNIGTTLGQVANNLITAITDAIPNAVDAAGNAIDVGLTLATGIVNSIVTAFDGTSLDVNLSSIVESIVSGLTNILPKAFELGGKIMSAGAHIVQGLFSSISTALSDVKASGVAEKLGRAATDLLKNLLSNIGGLTGNTEVTTFLSNLGQSIIDGIGTLGSIVGDFAGKLIGYLFSEEGLTDILNAGVTIGNLIFSGIMNGLTGLGNFLKEMITSTLVSWGVLDAEEIKAAKEAGKELAEQTAQAFKDAGEGEFEMGTGLETLINWANWRGGQNRSEITAGAQDMVSNFNAALSGAAANADTGESFRDAVLSSLFWSNDDLMTKALEENIDLSAEDLDIAGVLSQLKIDLNDLMPNYDDIGFWENLLAAMKSGNSSEIMKVVNDALTAVLASSKEQTEETAEEIAEAASGIAPEVKAAEEELKKLSGQAEETTNTVVQAIGESGNELAKNSMATAIKENADEVEAEALSLEDGVVKTFLMTMGTENGYLIGENFVLAMGTAMSDKTVDMSAIALAAGQAAYSALSGSASYANGYTIGYNFGSGFVAGIESMIDRAASAAASLGAAGTDSLSGIIREGSPSRVTAETGVNFGLGFINSILDGAEGAADAAARMGRSAGDALAYTVRGIGAEAAEIPLPLRNGYGQMAASYPGGQQNNPAIEQMTNRIIEAMSHMGVYIDGEPAGHVLTPYISEEIAHNTSVRR